MLHSRIYDNRTFKDIALLIGEKTGQYAGQIFRETLEELRDNIKKKHEELMALSRFFYHCMYGHSDADWETLRYWCIRELSNKDVSNLVALPPRKAGKKMKKAAQKLRQCISRHWRDKHPLLPEMQIDDDMLKWFFTFSKSEQDALFSLIENTNNFDMMSDEDYFQTLFTFKLNHSKETCSHTDRTLELLRGVIHGETAFYAKQHIVVCESCRKLALSLPGVTILPDAAVESTANTQKPRRTWPKSFAIAATVLVSLGLGYFLRYKTAIEPTESTRETMSPKSSADRLFVVAKRGESEFRLNPLNGLKRNDSIGLFYSAEEPGYLMILNIDNSGQVAPLYPIGSQTSGRMDSGIHVPLPVEGTVEEGDGCEWIVAVFSDTPLEIEDVAAQLKRSERSSVENKCRLEPDIRRTRTVRVLSVTREKDTKAIDR